MLNDAALADLAAWVPEIFPAAWAYQETGFRVSSSDRGPGDVCHCCGRQWRQHQEDLSFHPIEGICDWAVADEGDPKEGSRTPIEVVMEHMFDVPAEDLAKREPTPEFEQAFEWLRERVLPTPPQGDELPPPQGNELPGRNADNEKHIIQALQVIKTTFGSDTWIKVGEALKSLPLPLWMDGNNIWGLGVWNSWSKKNAKGYTNFDDVKTHWNALADDGLINDLFKKQLPKLEHLTYGDLEQEPLEHLRWIVPGFILAEAVNGIFGAGAVGKDLLLFQLCIALISGAKWLGIEVPTTWNGEPIRVLWFPVEDPKKELRRRQHNIATYYTQRATHKEGEVFEPCKENLRIIPKKKGVGTVIAVYDHKAGVVKPTERYAQICAEIEDFKPHVVIMGNRVNIFSVNQNDDAQARQCMELLDDLCEGYGVTVIMPAHPSQTGQNTGSGKSGTVQWNNACRMRSYLSYIEADRNDPDPDPNMRQLEVKKSNWSELERSST